jgi:hypothetical protein
MQETFLTVCAHRELLYTLMGKSEDYKPLQKKKRTTLFVILF